MGAKFSLHTEYAAIFYYSYILLYGRIENTSIFFFFNLNNLSVKYTDSYPFLCSLSNCFVTD